MQSRREKKEGPGRFILFFMVGKSKAVMSECAVFFRLLARFDGGKLAERAGLDVMPNRVAKSRAFAKLCGRLPDGFVKLAHSPKDGRDVRLLFLFEGLGEVVLHGMGGVEG
jgi:hypothetical protein